MTVYDGRQSGSFTKLVAKPHTKFCILDLLDSKSDARGENLPDALLGCSLRAVMRNTLRNSASTSSSDLLAFVSIAQQEHWLVIKGSKF
jgi:hypothetical protein